jgi:hypothetical protein
MAGQPVAPESDEGGSFGCLCGEKLVSACRAEAVRRRKHSEDGSKVKAGPLSTFQRLTANWGPEYVQTPENVRLWIQQTSFKIVDGKPLFRKGSK